MGRLIDLTGRKFGRLTVVGRSPVRSHHIVWRCICICGNEHAVSVVHLRNGHTTSCGCLRREKISERSLIDLTGRKFGRLTVIGPDPVRVHEHVVWRCICDCGNERLVFGQLLREGRTTSCGCFRQEQLIKRNTRHGHARGDKKTSIYNRWRAMLARCFNPNNKSYPYYGGREDVPITVCEDYRSFVNYYADVGDPPSPGLSIDRADNNRGYEPDNLRWVDSFVQANNRRPYKRKGRRASLTKIQAYLVSLMRAASTSSPSGAAP
jgi:hypothetical protein